MNVSSRLGDVCEFKYGKGLPQSERRPGSVAVYGSNGQVGSHDNAVTDGRTIIIGRKGSIGEVNFSDAPCWPIDTTYFVDRSCTKVDLRWLYHALGMLGLTKLNKGAAVPGLNRDDAYERRLWVPPTEREQQRIAAVLDKADAIRLKRRQALADIDALLRATSYKCSEIRGRIQKASKRRLSRTCANKSWTAYTPLRVIRKPLRRILQFAPQTFRIRFLDFSTTKYVEKEEYEERNIRHRPVVGDIIYSREGERLGIAAIVPQGLNVCLGQRTMLFSVNRKRATPEYVWRWLNSKSTYELATASIGGATSLTSTSVIFAYFKYWNPPFMPKSNSAECALKLSANESRY